MGYIDKIRSKINLKSIKRGSSSSVDEGSKDLPLDHQLTFVRFQDEKWQYREGHIYVNDTDVEELIEYKLRDVRLWCGISEALSEYQDMVETKNGRDNSRFYRRVNSIQDRILCNMKYLYDEKTDGVYLSLGDGEFLLNNFNVRAFLAMYHLKPTDKARKFLLGLKSKLVLILVNRNGTPQYERVHRVVEQIYQEVVDALSVPPIETRALPSSFRDKSL